MVAVALTATAVVALDRPKPAAPASTAAASPRPTEAAPVPPPPVGTTYRDFIYETSVVTAPTATKAQSKLWYADGTWWAGLVQPATNRQTIFRLDWATQQWQDTGTLVDERPFADPDFLWSGEHLYVVSAGPGLGTRNAARVLRFSFDAKAHRYVLDPNFPVTISQTGGTAVIARDSKGTLWVTYAADGKIMIAQSLDHDAHWSTPVPLGTAIHVTPDDISTIVAFGPGKIGVMWSDQRDSRVFFAVHQDGDPIGTWSDPEVVMDGLGSSDDHINLKTYPDGNGTGVVAALKTSQDALQPPNPNAPLIVLAMRPAAGGWQTYLVSRVRDRHTRAIVMVDDDARMLYVAATSPARGGEILYKRTSLDAIAFDTGRGERLVSSPIDTHISNASSTKQSLSTATGLVVLASDNDTGRYLHAVVDLGAGLPPADPADKSRPDRPVAAPAGPIELIDNDFEPWPVGDADGSAWYVRATDPPASLRIVDDGAGGRALRVTAAPDGAAVRACRAHADVPDSGLTETLRVRFNGTGTSDATLVSLRGSGGEAGSVRVTTRGRLAWFDGLKKVRSTTVVKPGTWYRVVVTVDQAGRTYGFKVTTDTGKPVLAKKGLAWRVAAVKSVREVCLETASGQPKASIDLADIRVLQVPSS